MAPTESTHATWVRVTGNFEDVLRQVPDDRWSAPAPPAGWTTIDVVRHLVEWVPGFLRGGSDVDLAPGPDVDEDPLGAWTHFASGVGEVLARPDVHETMFIHDRAGDRPLDEAIAMFVLSDVVMHTWDLAKGAGLEVTLDPELVHQLLVGLRPMADTLYRSGHYGRPVPVPHDASEQDQLIGLIGRDPAWSGR